MYFMAFGGQTGFAPGYREEVSLVVFLLGQTSAVASVHVPMVTVPLHGWHAWQELSTAE